MSTQQEFKNTIIFTLLDKFNRQHTFDELTDEVVERIRHIADMLCGGRVEEPEEPVKFTVDLDEKLATYGLHLYSLYRAGIFTFKDLVSNSVNDLIRLHGFGKGSLVRVEKFLDKFNLKLKGR